MVTMSVPAVMIAELSIAVPILDLFQASMKLRQWKFGTKMFPS